MSYESSIALPAAYPPCCNVLRTTRCGCSRSTGSSRWGFGLSRSAIGDSNNDLFLILQWESLAERENKFGAFAKDAEWLEVKRKSEEDGPVEASITTTILVPTTFSMLR